MLTDAGILERRSKYPCCVEAFLHAAILAWDRGDTECGNENYENALYMLWASRVMCDTPIEGDEHPGCVTNSEATAWASRADCLCTPCGCETPVTDCTIVPDYTVLEGLAFADLPVSPGVDDSYYILSGTNVGTIATVFSASYVFTAIPNDTIVWASDTNIYYTNLGTTPGLLFPEPLLINVVAGYWSVTTNSPQTEDGRTWVLQALRPEGWYNVSLPTAEGPPYQLVNLTGLVVEDIRFQYTDNNGCVYYSGLGTFDPPIVPPVACTITPAYTVVSAVDASQQGLTSGGIFLIASDESSMGNEWAANLNSIVTVAGAGVYVYQPLITGQTVYALDTGLYWRLIVGGMAHLFPELTATYGLVPPGYFLESDWPSASAAGTRLVIVEALIGATWTIVWSGYEYDLPQQLSNLEEFLGLRATYVVDGCAYQVTGAAVSDPPFEVSTDCSEQIYIQYRYVEASTPLASMLFTAPVGQTVTVTFIAGEMDGLSVIRAYDGSDDTGAPIPSLTGNYASLVGVAGNSTGQYLYMEFDMVEDMPADLDTWLFAVHCTTGAVPPTADVTQEEKCDEWSQVLTVTPTFLGDATSIGISYSVDGGPYTTISGITTLDPVPLGAFSLDSDVNIILIHEQDPLANVNLGYFTSTGVCPITDNDCAPSGAFKIDQIGDLSELPDPAPFSGWAFLIISDTTNIGTYPVGEMLGWDTDIPNDWSPITYTPGIIATDVPPQFWYSNGPGTTQPYPLYPVAELTPTGTTPNNWTIWAPAIVTYGIPLNTPFALEVRNGYEPWNQVGTFTLQQMIVPLAIPIVVPFTNARIVWNYNSCPLSLTGGAIINS